MFNRQKVIEGLLHNIHAMRHKLMESYTNKNSSITPSQGFVLRFVAQNKATNVKEVARALYITSSAATQLINGLVANGYLLRKEHPDDRRVISLSLSEKAKKIFKEQGLQKMTKLFSVLTDQELSQYAALNEKIARSLVNKI